MYLTLNTRKYHEVENSDAQHVSCSSKDSDVLSPHRSLGTSNVVLSMKTEISVPRMSSPLPEYLNDSVDFPSHVSSIPEFASEASKQVSIAEMSQPLYEGAKIGRANTILLLRAFSSNANLSDANTLKLHALVQSVLPKDNSLPSIGEKGIGGKFQLISTFLMANLCFILRRVFGQRRESQY